MSGLRGGDHDGGGVSELVASPLRPETPAADENLREAALTTACNGPGMGDALGPKLGPIGCGFFWTATYAGDQKALCDKTFVHLPVPR